MFNIPDGVDEFVYDEDRSARMQDIDVDSGAQEVIIPEDDNAGTESPDTSGRPPAPKILGIIKQKMQTLSNGQEVVDVVFRVENIDGAEYRFRISKVL
jgi:hypothetical protein